MTIRGQPTRLPLMEFLWNLADSIFLPPPFVPFFEEVV
jgi:hypothetical protein